MNTIKFAVADDHKIFRQGLIAALSGDPELQCIGEAENGIKALSLVAQQSPDVMLLDIKMPEMDGIAATKEIRRLHPDVKILILTTYDDEHLIMHLLEAGANGYLLKNADAVDITIAIHTVMEHNYYFNDLVSKTMLRSLMNKGNIGTNFKERIKLTDKETKVLELICQEFTAAEIADKIFLSKRTVEGIRAELLEKIGVRNTAGLVIYALKNGIIS